MIVLILFFFFFLPNRAWNAARQINLRTSESNTSILRPLSVTLPHGATTFPIDFPKTVEEAQRLDCKHYRYSQLDLERGKQIYWMNIDFFFWWTLLDTQCVALLERYGQASLIVEGNEEKTRTCLLEFIGCIPHDLSSSEKHASNVGTAASSMVWSDRNTHTHAYIHISIPPLFSAPHLCSPRR